MYEVYCTDGPMEGQTITIERLGDFDILEHGNLFDPSDNIDPETVTYHTNKWNETFYKRVPKLEMINLLFGRQAYTASICEPEPPPEMGEWELMKEADFIDNFDQWFAEKCYQYGLLTDNEIW